METVRKFFETKVFGVCHYLGEKFGIRSSVIRMYFIYASFLTFGSPIILYLVIAFWINLKQYLHLDRPSVWDL